jgi:hypothetical protein
MIYLLFKKVKDGNPYKFHALTARGYIVVAVGVDDGIYVEFT